VIVKGVFIKLYVGCIYGNLEEKATWKCSMLVPSDMKAKCVHLCVYEMKDKIGRKVLYILLGNFMETSE